MNITKQLAEALRTARCIAVEQLEDAMRAFTGRPNKYAAEQRAVAEIDAALAAYDAMPEPSEARVEAAAKALAGPWEMPWEAPSEDDWQRYRSNAKEVLTAADAVSEPKAAPLALTSLSALCGEISKHLGSGWLVVGPDGSRFQAETPHRAANAASRHFGRMSYDPEKATAFAAVMAEARRKSEVEKERLLAEFGSLDCPACGGSGHIGDTQAPTRAALSQQPAVPEGWQLVPVDPTPEMLKAADDGDDAYTQRNFGPSVQRVQQGPYDHWVAMLSAAPQYRLGAERADGAATPPGLATDADIRRAMGPKTGTAIDGIRYEEHFRFFRAVYARLHPVRVVNESLTTERERALLDAGPDEQPGAHD